MGSNVSVKTLRFFCTSQALGIKASSSYLSARASSAGTISQN